MLTQLSIHKSFSKDMEINEEILSSQKNVTFITKQYLQDFFTSPRHYHLEYEIAYIEESNGKLLVGNNVVDFKEDNLFMFAPRLVHCFKNHRNYRLQKKPAKATIILFRKEFLGDDFLDRKEAHLLKKLFANAEEGIQIINPDPDVVNLLKKLPKDDGFRGVIDFLSILDYLSRCDDYKLLTIKWFKKRYYILKDDRLNLILDYVEKNFSKEMIFRNVAQMANMSEPAFSRYFRHKTEKTFTHYVNEVRITNAQKLLMETNNKIIDISNECGYNNLTYFNRCFKKINGITPKHFRELYSSPENIK
jgi:AraC-like DNA-binding protein